MMKIDSIRKSVMRERHRQAFSLIEVMMVIGLLTATASVAMFRFGREPKLDPARQSAQEFVAALRAARELAIKQDASVTILIDQKSPETRWMFSIAGNANGVASRWEVCTAGDAIIEGTSIPIRINAAGNASYAGDWTIRGQNDFRVTLEPIGARVTMKAL